MDITGYAIKRCAETFCGFELKYYIDNLLDYIESRLVSGVDVDEQDVDEWIYHEVRLMKGHDD